MNQEIRLALMVILTFAFGFLLGLLFSMSDKPNPFGWAVVIVSFGVLVFAWTFILLKRL